MFNVDYCLIVFLCVGLCACQRISSIKILISRRIAFLFTVGLKSQVFTSGLQLAVLFVFLQGDSSHLIRQPPSPIRVRNYRMKLPSFKKLSFSTNTAEFVFREISFYVETSCNRLECYWIACAFPAVLLAAKWFATYVPWLTSRSMYFYISFAATQVDPNNVAFCNVSTFIAEGWVWNSINFILLNFITRCKYHRLYKISKLNVHSIIFHELHNYLNCNNDYYLSNVTIEQWTSVKSILLLQIWRSKPKVELLYFNRKRAYSFCFDFFFKIRRHKN